MQVIHVAIHRCILFSLSSGEINSWGCGARRVASRVFVDGAGLMLWCNCQVDQLCIVYI